MSYGIGVFKRMSCFEWAGAIGRYRNATLGYGKEGISGNKIVSHFLSPYNLLFFLPLAKPRWKSVGQGVWVTYGVRSSDTGNRAMKGRE